MAAVVDVLDLYDKLRLAPDEEARARLIAHAFSLLEARYPHLDDLVTNRELSETELKLIKEIEQVRADLKETELKLTKEIKETELKLTKEIEQVRSELKETELKLIKEIEQVRAELKVEIARSHAGLLKWSFLFWVTQLGAILLLLWRLTGGVIAGG